MQIRTRAEWGARPKKRPRGAWGTIEGIAVHHTVTADDGDIASRLRGIQNYHMDTKGWADIAYNYLIDRNGNIWEARGMIARSGANGTTASNKAYVAVAFIGTYTDKLPTQAAMSAFTELRCMTIVDQLPSATRVRPHSDFKNTGCPGMIEGILGDLANRCDLPAPLPPIVGDIPSDSMTIDPNKVCSLVMELLSQSTP